MLERWVLFESKEKKEKLKQNGVVRKDLVEVELEPGIFKGRKAWIGRGRRHVYRKGMHPLQSAVSKLSRNLLFAKHRVWVQKVIVGEAKKKKNSVAGAEATKVV